MATLQFFALNCGGGRGGWRYFIVVIFRWHFPDQHQGAYQSEATCRVGSSAAVVDSDFSVRSSEQQNQIFRCNGLLIPALASLTWLTMSAPTSQSEAPSQGTRAGPGRRSLLNPSGFTTASAASDGGLIAENVDRGRSRSRGGDDDGGGGDVADAANAAHRYINEAVAKEIGKSLPVEVAKTIKRHTSELYRSIEKLQRVNTKLVSIRSEISTLQRGEVPKSMKPFHVAFESKHLDDQRLLADRKFELTVPTGKSIRETKEILYLAYHAWQKDLDAMLVEKSQSDLREVTKKSTFVDLCVAADKRQEEAWEKLGLILEEGEAVVHGMSREDLTARAISLYKNVVNKIATTVWHDEDASSKRDKERARILRELTERTPKERLEEMIDARISSYKKSAKKKKTAVDLTTAYLVGGGISEANLDEVLQGNVPGPAADAKGVGGGARGKGKGKSKGKKAQSSKGSQTGGSSQEPYQARDVSGGGKGKNRGTSQTQSSSAKGKQGSKGGKGGKGKGKTKSPDVVGKNSGGKGGSSKGYQ